MGGISNTRIFERNKMSSYKYHTTWQSHQNEQERERENSDPTEQAMSCLPINVACCEIRVTQTYFVLDQSKEKLCGIDSETEHDSQLGDVPLQEQAMHFTMHTHRNTDTDTPGVIQIPRLQGTPAPNLLDCLLTISCKHVSKS